VKVLVLGGGQIAKAVARASSGQHEIITRSHAELDIADESAVVRTLSEAGADWIVNAAAFTAVDLAEDHAERTHLVNDAAVGYLARACAQHACRLLHLSSDFVFDGSSGRAYLPSDETNPLNVYGRSKLGGERRVMEECDSGIVLRTSWVYASAGRNFVLTMLNKMRAKDRINVVCDQIGAPTWAASVAAAIWSMIDAAVEGGLYHWTDLGVASWYDFAVAIQDEALALGLLQQTIPIMPVSGASYPTRARRPAFSVLDSSRTRAAIQVPANHWRHNLRAMLNELRIA
jgi:dTDP-4-dehydrorhamnose reductase